MRRFRVSFSFFMFSLGLCFGQGAKDVKIPYTVGDRELILEIKLRLEAHEKAMNEKLDAYQKANDAKLEAYQKATDAKLEALNRRFDSVDSRFDFLQNLSLAILAAILASIVGVAAYLVWTQRRERQLAKQSVQVESLTDAQLERLVEKVSERLNHGQVL